MKVLEAMAKFNLLYNSIHIKYIFLEAIITQFLYNFTYLNRFIDSNDRLFPNRYKISGRSWPEKG